MRQLPGTQNAPVVRTDYEDSALWDRIRELICAPQKEASYAFYANVEFIEDDELRDLTVEDLLLRVPDDGAHAFLFVVDRVATSNAEFPILVVDLYTERGRTFRAIPSQIQGIENNLSISNMDFAEFADNADDDGVFRGFRS